MAITNILCLWDLQKYGAILTNFIWPPNFERDGWSLWSKSWDWLNRRNSSLESPILSFFFFFFSFFFLFLSFLFFFFWWLTKLSVRQDWFCWRYNYIARSFPPSIGPSLQGSLSSLPLICFQFFQQNRAKFVDVCQLFCFWFRVVPGNLLFFRYQGSRL